MSSVEVRTSTDGDVAVLTIVGEIAVDTDAVICAAIERLLASGEPSVLRLDLADVAFADSYGLRVLITTQRQMAERHGTLVVDNPSAVVRRLLTLTGLDRLLTIEPSDARLPP